MTSPLPFVSRHVPQDGWLYKDRLPSILPDFSLIFVVDKPRAKVLLGWKKRGFGARLWNGFGGKPERGESMLACARRELEEESGLVAIGNDIYCKGELIMSRPDGDGPESDCTGLRIHVYICEKWTGDLAETEEMMPAWFSIYEVTNSTPATAGDMVARDLPLDEMWPEASLFLRPLLQSVMLDKRDARLKVYSEYQMLPINSVDRWQCLTVLHSSPSKDLSKFREVLAGWEIELDQAVK